MYSIYIYTPIYIYIHIQSYTYTHTHTIYMHVYLHVYIHVYTQWHTHTLRTSVKCFLFSFQKRPSNTFPKTDDWNHQLRRLMLLVLRPKRFIGPCWKGKPLGRLGQLVFRFRILEMQCIEYIYIYNIYIYIGPMWTRQFSISVYPSVGSSPAFSRRTRWRQPRTCGRPWGLHRCTRTRCGLVIEHGVKMLLFVLD